MNIHVESERLKAQVEDQRAEALPAARLRHEIDRPFSDIPTGIWKAYLAVWVGFFATLWWMFGGHGESAFMVTIASGFGAIFFAVPIAMIGRAPHGLKRAVAPKVETLTGLLTVRDAAAQILLIPVAVTLGLIGMAIFAL